MAQGFRTTISWDDEIQNGLDAYGRRRQIHAVATTARMMIERGLALSDLENEQAIERLAASEKIEFLEALKIVVARGLAASKG